MQDHGYGKAGEDGNGILQPRESGVDHRVGDAHQLDVEQQGKKEKGNVLLGQAGVAQGQRSSGNMVGKSAVVMAEKSACRPSSWPSPQAQKQDLTPAA